MSSPIAVRPFVSPDAAGWNTLLQRLPASTIAHQHEWRAIIADNLGHRPEYLVAEQDGVIVGCLPLFRVTTWWRAVYLVSIPWIDYGGILAETPEAENALLDYARELAKTSKARFLEFRSIERLPHDLPSRTDKVTFLLPLNADPELIWKGFDAKLRNQIRKSQKSGLTTEFVGEAGVDEFYEVFAHNMRDLGTPVWGRKLFDGILRTMPDRAQLILVRKDNQVIAGGLVLRFQDRYYVPSASSYRWALEFCPNHALYWAVIERGCREGLSFLDFGRSSWNGPTFNFKKQWGAPPTQLTWQYILPTGEELPAINPANPKYRLFISLWQKLPLPLANWLGPKVIRNFP